MPNCTRTGLKISGSRCSGVENTNFKFVIQIIANTHRGGQESGTILNVYSHL